MSLALENNRINGLFHNIPIVDRSTEVAMPMRVVERDDDLSQGLTTSSSSSSIGKNSDDESGDDEVESKLNNNSNNENNINNNTENTPFDSAVDDLEQALPIRRGISKFYNGKSKSFASLSDATASTSIEDITKPEDPYSRKRKNLLAYHLLKGKSQRYPFPKYPEVPKRPISSSHSTLNFGIGSIDENESSPGTSWSNGSRSPSDSPPALPHMPWRSFSLADLQHYGVSPNPNDTKFDLSPLMENRTKPDEVF